MPQDVDPRDYGAKPIAEKLSDDDTLNNALVPRFDSLAAIEKAARAADGGRVVIQGGRFWASRAPNFYGAELHIAPGGDLSRGL